MGRYRTINLPAPYLRRVWLDPSLIPDREAYPFCLPLFADNFELSFDSSITIIVGENGTGKSTMLEGIAALAGYDDAGGGKGYRPVDHSTAREKMGGQLSKALRASWLPKITNGWLMAYPGARLLRLTKRSLEPVTLCETDHYKVMREFYDDPTGFIQAAIGG